jgi:hypothetical protein
MYKYACQSNLNLTKLHDGICSRHEQQRLREGNMNDFPRKANRFLYYFSV